MTETPSNAQIQRRLVALLKTIAPEIDEASLAAAETLRSQVDLDSIDWLNFLVSIAGETGVEIPEADYGRLATLDDLTGYVRKRMR